MGAEAIAGVSLLSDRLQGQAAYTFLDTEDKTTGEPLAYRPDHLLTTSASLRLAAFLLAVDYRMASAFDRFQVFNDPRIDPLLPMRVLDARLAYRFGRADAAPVGGQRDELRVHDVGAEPRADPALHGVAGNRVLKD